MSLWHFIINIIEVLYEGRFKSEVVLFILAFILLFHYSTIFFMLYFYPLIFRWHVWQAVKQDDWHSISRDQNVNMNLIDGTFFVKCSSLSSHGD